MRLILSKGAIHALTYSSGSGTYLLTGANRTISLYNPFPTSNSPHTTQLIQTYSAHGYEILDLAINRTNSAFVSVGGDRQVFLWDVSSARTLRRWTGHGARVNACAWGGDDDSVIITGGYDATVRIWDVKSQSTKPIQVLEEAGDSVTCVGVSGWEIVAAGVDGRIRTYDLRMGMLRVDVVGCRSFPSSMFEKREGMAHEVIRFCYLIEVNKGLDSNASVYTPILETGRSISEDPATG